MEEVLTRLQRALEIIQSTRAELRGHLVTSTATTHESSPPALPSDPAGGPPDHAPPPQTFNYQGERGQQIQEFLNWSDTRFETMVSQGSIETDYRFVPSGEPVWGHPNQYRESLDKLAAGWPAEAFRQSRYFEVTPVPGDGLIVIDFWIAEDVSGVPGFDALGLAGDGRGPTTHPLSPDLAADDSRMMVVIDRETGRGMVTVSPTTVRVIDVPGSIDSLFNDPLFRKGTQYHDILTVPARPIEFGPNPGLTSGVHNNYFEINSSTDSISVDYDAINSVTAPTHLISVDGPLVLDRDASGQYHTSALTDVDAYPSIAVVQYLPDGTRQVIYSQENQPVIPGAVGD